jgi:hypothetical protein
MGLATVLGIMGVIANTCWPLIRERRYLLFGQILACIFMGLHFLLLSAYTGAAVMAVAGMQALLAIPLESHPRFKSVYLASLLLTPLVCFYTWQGYSSIFSSLALILFCIGNLQVNTKHLRIFLILCIFVWIGHNVMVSSYPALLSNSLALLTSVYGLIRDFMPNKVINERLRLDVQKNARSL